MSGGLGSSLLALALVLSNSLVVVVADRTDNAIGVDSTAVEAVGGDTARVQKQAALSWVVRIVENRLYFRVVVVVVVVVVVPVDVLCISAVDGNLPAPFVAPFAVVLVPKAASRVWAHRGFARGETPRQSP